MYSYSIQDTWWKASIKYLHLTAHRWRLLPSPPMEPTFFFFFFFFKEDYDNTKIEGVMKYFKVPSREFSRIKVTTHIARKI